MTLTDAVCAVSARAHASTARRQRPTAARAESAIYDANTDVPFEDLMLRVLRGKLLR